VTARTGDTAGARQTTAARETAVIAMPMAAGVTVLMMIFRRTAVMAIVVMAIMMTVVAAFVMAARRAAGMMVARRAVMPGGTMVSRAVVIGSTVGGLVYLGIVRGLCRQVKWLIGGPIENLRHFRKIRMIILHGRPPFTVYHG
ncbi:MAG TPA: hypothetical protein VN462_06655, partial [Negativicutes bacterium]|nr:hypothetical protein [Negativicutes bacterium]